MTFFRYKTVDKRTYLYREERKRVPGRKHPVSISKCLGRVDAGDRSVIGHSTEFEDMQQGYDQLTSREATAAPTFSQESFLAETAAPPDAAATDAAVTADGSDATGEASGQGGEQDAAEQSSVNTNMTANPLALL